MRIWHSETGKVSKTSRATRRCWIALWAGVAALTCLATSAFAEATISVYSGVSFSPHSDIEYRFPDGTSGKFGPGWDSANFESPPYYGVRATWWLDQMPEVGLAIDFTHAKVKANLDDPRARDFTHLEFTDGINFLTANALYRYDTGTRFTPYAGVGVGAAIPYVETTQRGSGVDTREYQITGVALQALAGVDYRITDRFSVFGEGKIGYAVVDADLEGGGSLETDVIVNQIILGITYKIF